MQNVPGKSFKCGPMALANVQKAKGDLSPEFSKEVYEIQSPQTGFNLVQVLDLANANGMRMQMAFREPGATVIFPCVVNWKLAHFGAITAGEFGKYHLEDPTFVQDFWITASAIDAESSGYFLVRAGELPAGWRTVEREEGEKVWGKGNTSSRDTGGVGAKDEKVPDSDCHTGMPVASVHAMMVSLSISDNPVEYEPAVGPGGTFTVSYSQRTTAPDNPNYSNLGPRWTFEWSSFVTYNPNAPSASATLSERGGGQLIYSGFSASSNNSTIAWTSPTRLLRSAATGAMTFERVYPDGSKEVFAKDDGVIVTGGTMQKKAFLTQIVDPSGNALTFGYDANLRMTTITDAVGQVTTIQYDPTALISDPAKFYRIANVVDPFGRTGNFTYDTSGRLQSIKDSINLTSSFSYGASNFIANMTTPYGNSTFTSTDGPGLARSVNLTDPQVGTERVEFVNSNFTASVDPSEVPSGPGLLVFNQWMNSRNTFYWDKKAYAEAPGDYSKARVYHWLHTLPNVNVTDRIIESTKEAFSSRVWYNYVGTSNA